MPRAIYKTWGRYTPQTVRRCPNDKKATYYIRQGQSTVEVEPGELDDLIHALLDVRIRSDRRVS